MNPFNVEKAAQITAYFALREGGSIDVLKVLKLVYLAERAYLHAYEIPLTGDTFVVTPDGPILAQILDQLDGSIPCNPKWKRHVGARTRHAVRAAPGVSIDALDHLSTANTEVLDEVWANYGHLDGFALRDLVHDDCAQWTAPNGSSRQISYSDLFHWLGKPNVETLVEGIETAYAIGSASMRYSPIEMRL
ncbi:MAG: Panacea domain-containing protein [Bosea sp. (in: a-proteobacteria)]|uniref:Panacea domain-containing protein n=1 Tax=Bosea sp. (in: a-proteobacteria) TaxID=1871050 RepID=UPI003F7BE466